METNLSKLRSSRVPWASKTSKLNHAKSEGLKKSEDDDMILVSCQCAGKDVKALVDTGCQYNLISSACVDRLGQQVRRICPAGVPQRSKIRDVVGLSLLGVLLEATLPVPRSISETVE
ncbi:Nuclear receptor-interacting protein 3, partial [Eschrichtius robustus]|nr:Nuclear receptor-interacting protein 3 [Eschrichtius robustus]